MLLFSFLLFPCEQAVRLKPKMTAKMINAFFILNKFAAKVKNPQPKPTPELRIANHKSTLTTRNPTLG